MPFEHLQAAQTGADSVTGCVPVAWVSAAFTFVGSGLTTALIYQTRRLKQITDMLIEKRRREEKDDSRTRPTGGSSAAG